MAAALAVCTAAGGVVQVAGAGEQQWRDSFLQAPYLRDTLVSLGILAETFETAVTWDRLEALIDTVRNEPQCQDCRRKLRARRCPPRKLPATRRSNAALGLCARARGA